MLPRLLWSDLVRRLVEVQGFKVRPAVVIDAGLGLAQGRNEWLRISACDQWA